MAEFTEEDLLKNIPALPEAQGITIKLAEVGHVICEFTAPDEFKNYHGAMHGGLIYLLCEIVAGMGCTTCGHDNVAITGSINYIKQCPVGEPLELECTTAHNGRSSAVHHVFVRTQAGKLIAESTYTMFVLGPLQH